ncbi:MAG: M90 family metallopeptidase [Gammaproteobacteria bacterium]
MNFLKRLQTRYILHRFTIKHHVWQAAIDELELLHGLSAVDKAHLRELSTLFLHRKSIVGVDIAVTETMRVAIAVQACLPILRLGLELLSGWTEVIVYPAAFYTVRDETDEYGFVHHCERVLSGEAWSRGPLILSWDDIEHDRVCGREGHNVVIHEIAHKLDMLNGSCNGMPPLHYRMSISDWTAALSEAYAELNDTLDHHERCCVNAYAATNPAEFFAVFSEYFFSAPEVLHRHFPDVYEQLRLYYRQDPFGRVN